MGKSDRMFEILLIFATLKLKTTENYQNDNIRSVSYDFYDGDVHDGYDDDIHDDDPSGLGWYICVST